MQSPLRTAAAQKTQRSVAEIERELKTFSHTSTKQPTVVEPAVHYQLTITQHDSLLQEVAASSVVPTRRAQYSTAELVELPFWIPSPRE